jgi:magnesium-transporting ATPase (P-type)
MYRNERVRKVLTGLDSISCIQVKEADCDIQEKECMLFAGTAISNGSCLAIVNSIGMATEIGKIQQQIQDASEEEEDSPLKKKIDNFGERLAQAPLLPHYLPSSC